MPLSRSEETDLGDIGLEDYGNLPSRSGRVRWRRQRRMSCAHLAG